MTASGATIFNAVFTPWPAHSGTYIAAAQTGLMTVTLDSTITGNIRTVSAYVTGIAGTGIYAYDASNTLLGQALLPSGSPANTLLSVTSSGNPIVRVDIHDGGTSFGVDDLSFATAPPVVPFASFTPALKISIGSSPNTDSFDFASRLTLGTSGAAFNPAADVVSLKIGAVTTTIPAGSFTTNSFGEFAFKGLIGGVNVRASMEPKGSNGYQVKISGTGTSLTGIANPVPLTLSIGNNAGSQSVTATITLPKPLKGLFINPFGQ